MFEVETAQERLPPPVHIRGCGVGGRGPQPHRFRGVITWEALYLQADQGAGDDQELAGVLAPYPAVGQSR